MVNNIDRKTDESIPHHYTVGDIVCAMKRCAVRHIIVKQDQEALMSFDEKTWIQLAFAVMIVTAGRKVVENG